MKKLTRLLMPKVLNLSLSWLTKVTGKKLTKINFVSHSCDKKRISDYFLDHTYSYDMFKVKQKSCTFIDENQVIVQQSCYCIKICINQSYKKPCISKNESIVQQLRNLDHHCIENMNITMYKPKFFKRKTKIIQWCSSVLKCKRLHLSVCDRVFD